jgi:4-hydroxy-2-oxoheptanedioate aldolase
MRNILKARLRAGEAVVGSWLAIPSVVSARYMAQLGFDYLTVDMEHNPIGIETASAMCGAIAQAGTTPLVRIPWNTPENIKRVLDCGAHGIVVPMVNTRAEAELAVAAARYPPAGFRSVGGTLHAMNFGVDAGTYYARANDELVVVVQAESPEGVANADEILSVPGVDAVFIGPNDLLAQMGRPPQMETEEPEFTAALERVRTVADRYGVAAGIHTAHHEQCGRRLRQGFRFMALASDARLMVAGAQNELRRVEIPGRATSSGEVLRY